MNRKEVLDAAALCVLQDRSNQYGPPEQSFGIIADLWSIILRPALKEGAKADPVQVTLCMDALKTARLIVNPGHDDSWIDKAGYAACGGELATNEGGKLPTLT